MDLREISDLQIKMDESHGFPVQFSNPKDKYDQLTKDLVGLFGEIGEFSNVVKKINIKQENATTYKLDISTAEDCLREELVDCFIYLIRIGAILKVDLESEILRKIGQNAIRYAGMQRE